MNLGTLGEDLLRADKAERAISEIRGHRQWLHAVQMEDYKDPKKVKEHELEFSQMVQRTLRTYYGIG